MYSQQNACFEHSIFFKVNLLNRNPNPSKGQSCFPAGWIKQPATHTLSRRASHSNSAQLSRLQTICANNVTISIQREPKQLSTAGTTLVWWIWAIQPIVFHTLLSRTSHSSMDSDLEAFSHNPTDGSFTALAFQLTVFTNYLNQLFLSY